MQIGQILLSKGFVTQDKYLLGQSLHEIEKRMGYRTNRLSEGAWVGVCLKLPEATQFDLKGYSQVAGHKHKDLDPNEYDITVLKRNALQVMKTEGADRIVKIFPVKWHDSTLSNDDQYPPGTGIPQWYINTPLSFRITNFLKNYPLGKYQ